MAKPEKTTAATEPTIAPPPLAPDSEPAPETQPEGVTPNYPAGVSMHQAGTLPNTSDRANRIAADPKSPPPGWKGSFSRCGGCGDFLGNADRCPTCAPAYVPPMAFNGGVL
jgi:hypothetical protein